MFTSACEVAIITKEARRQPTALQKAIQKIEEELKICAKKGLDHATVYLDDVRSKDRIAISIGLDNAKYSCHWHDVNTDVQRIYISWSKFTV